MQGVIYILTNPSFPDYVKIGYADDLKQRLSQLNDSECTPFAFRAYAVYYVDDRLQDVTVHHLIDSLNPTLRSCDSVDGRIRKREFFAMSPEAAYCLLDDIAKISGTEDRLFVLTSDGREISAAELEQQKRGDARRSPFSFDDCDIKAGDVIELVDHSWYTATVKDKRHVEFEGETYSLGDLTMRLLHLNHTVQASSYWMYHGEVLSDIRDRKCKETEREKCIEVETARALQKGGTL